MRVNFRERRVWVVVRRHPHRAPRPSRDERLRLVPALLQPPPVEAPWAVAGTALWEYVLRIGCVGAERFPV